ncbi:hypothetical protein ABT364_19775 [Massilia sp. SR12]
MMVDYVPYQLPEKIETMILAFAERTGLFTGCFDLIETEGGDFIFLEVNPEGVWGLHDDIIGGAISSCVAESLVELDRGVTRSDQVRRQAAYS